MSTGTRIPYADAVRVAQGFCNALGLVALTESNPTDPLAFAVVGSLRRECADVGDIELMLPWPSPGDPLHDRLARHFWLDEEPQQVNRTTQRALWGPGDETATLAGPPRGQRWGRPVKGFKPGFRYAQLVMTPASIKVAVSIDLWRFDAGPEGNRGWIELIRTGPGEFGQACLARWKKVSNGGYSDKGYPRYQDGHPIAVPTEEAAFKLLYMEYIEPRDRRVEAMP